MGGKQESLRRARLVLGTAVAAALVVPIMAITPAGASPPSGRVRPPRDALHAAGVRAFAGSSPYNVTSRACGDTRPAAVPVGYSTLFAYGSDGGDNAYGSKGGGGSVAVGSIALPVGTVLNAQPGCKGQAASLLNHVAPAGGKAAGTARGGAGGMSDHDGWTGGGGGGYSGWYRGNLPLVEAAAGGGAGGAIGGDPGGAGGDGGSRGANAGGDLGSQFIEGGEVPATQPTGVLDVLPGAWRSGAGGHFDLFGTGGGGGGSGTWGGWGGMSGLGGEGIPGAGGGGGTSWVYTDAGYWLDFGGTGHGTGQDGLVELVTVRALTRRPTFPGRNVVRGVAPNGTRGGGYEVLGNGDIRSFAQGVNPTAATGALWWPGQDVARGIAVLPDRSGGYVVDKFGQLHAFGIGTHTPPKVTDRVLWPGKDIARGVTVLADGTGGYVLGRDGRLYSFAIGTHPKPPDAQRVPRWSGQDVARGITAPFLDEHGVAGGWIVDPFGGLHPWGRLFGGPTPDAVGPNIAARGVLSFVAGEGGFLVDGAGNLSPFASPGYP
jgi:hypothetical protein